MNAFADTMFTLLLGWVRGLAQSLFSAISSDKTHGFFQWFGDHWMALALILILAGVAADFIVWMVRWRPYLLWRTWFRKLARRMTRHGVREKEFKKGYTDGVEGVRTVPAPSAMAYPPVQAPPAYIPPERQPWTRRVPYTDGTQPAWTPVQPSLESARNQRRQEPPAEPAFEEEFMPPIRQKPSAMQQDTGRRRRSEKHQHGLAGAVNAVKNRLNAQEEEEIMLDGLPPAVNKEQAFHDPVYPKGEETGRYPQ
jgi:hypothetical protein